MNKKLLFFALIVLTIAANAQTTVIQPTTDYTELPDPKLTNTPAQWAQLKRNTHAAWGTTDVRYPKHGIPNHTNNSTIQLKAWRGERIHAQALLWTNRPINQLTIQTAPLKQGKQRIDAQHIETHFVRYTMADVVNKDGSGCGLRPNKAEWDSLLVADVLDNATYCNIEANTVQPIWVKINVPYDTPAGTYHTTLTLSGKGMKAQKLNIALTVVNQTLTKPNQWNQHLDLWQNPYAIARYHNVKLWSKEHFDLMRPIMKMLANAGQRSITTSIMEQPWDAQTFDPYHSMITRTRHIDGSWSYDYTVFDRWVDFMMNDIGINQTISCYTMIPWALKFDYFDQATNTMQFIHAKPGDEAYTQYWKNFLIDFSRHLRAKGWFEKTAISMDERPLEAMQEAIKVIKAADPAFKITLAGNYHPEIQADLYYLSIPYNHQYPADVLAQRRAKGQISTVYTCCTEAFPNMFTVSNPAESAWTAIHALAAGYDGYLRWAAMSWTENPLLDTRHSRFAAGDCFNIYPEARSSIRFERLVEGLQACEKVRIIRQQITNNPTKQQQLNTLLQCFTPEGRKKSTQSAGADVQTLSNWLNQ